MTWARDCGLCSVPDCGATLSRANTSSVCRRHSHTSGFCRCRVCTDPEFAERNRERMKALHADPEFAKRHRERRKALHADPEFAKRHRERMKALHADPEFAKRHRERMKALRADPERNPLVLLTPKERDDYDLLRRNGGATRDEALRSIGRADLIRESKT